MGSYQETSSTPSQFGFRIYKLTKDGPLAKAGAKEITDFIIPPIEVLTQKNSFNDWIISLADKTITIRLYSLLHRRFKYIEIKTNPLNSKEGILGAAVKYENFENADKNLLHITSVAENSFAKNKLNLIPNDDYIIATKTKNTPIISLNKEGYNPLEILNIVINSNIGNDLSFFIYNIKTGFRVVETKLENEENNNNFTLGCDVAYGALHEFPRGVVSINDNIKEIKENKEIKKIISENVANNDKKESEIKTNENKEGDINNIKKEIKNIEIVEEDII